MGIFELDHLECLGTAEPLNAYSSHDLHNPS
jgi:hypothetical protein